MSMLKKTKHCGSFYIFVSGAKQTVTTLSKDLQDKGGWWVERRKSRAEQTHMLESRYATSRASMRM